MDSPHPISGAEAALALGQALLDSGQPVAAIESFRRAARDGAPLALTMLGRIHERGWGVPPDPATAAIWYRRAVGAGEPWAMFNLADLHLSGSGVTRDRAAAHGLYAMAARHGHGRALNMLGMLAEAAGGERETAAAYFRAGAMAGDPWAMVNLARQRLAAGAVDAALGWLERAMETGFPACWRAMAAALANHPEPRIRTLAATAAAAAQARAAIPSPAEKVMEELVC